MLQTFLLDNGTIRFDSILFGILTMLLNIQYTLQTWCFHVVWYTCNSIVFAEDYKMLVYQAWIYLLKIAQMMRPSRFKCACASWWFSARFCLQSWRRQLISSSIPKGVFLITCLFCHIKNESVWKDSFADLLRLYFRPTKAKLRGEKLFAHCRARTLMKSQEP